MALLAAVILRNKVMVALLLPLDTVAILPPGTMVDILLQGAMAAILLLEGTAMGLHHLSNIIRSHNASIVVWVVLEALRWGSEADC